jgi:hypothetical protein
MAYDPLSSAGIGAAIASAEDAVPVIEAIFGSRSARVGEALAIRAIASDARWQGYRARLREAYRAERRWLGDAFWARRSREPDAGGSSARAP